MEWTQRQTQQAILTLQDNIYQLKQEVTELQIKIATIGKLEDNTLNGG